MAYKYDEAFELMRFTATDVVSSEEKWCAFLKCSAMNYKRPFYNQLLIFNQRPDATALATFDYWNSKSMARRVKKGSKGVVTINPSTEKREVLFDVSDTVSATGAKLPIWNVTEDTYGPLTLALQEHYDIDVVSDDLAALLLGVAKKEVDGVFSQLFNAVLECRTDSLLEEMSHGELENVLHETLVNSVSYVLLARCNCSPDDFVDMGELDFSYISSFNSYDTIAALGDFANNISKGILRDIALSARSIEKIINLRDNEVKEVARDGNNIQNGRGLSDPEHLSAETGNDLREVRNASEELSEEREVLDVQLPDDERSVVGASERDRRESERESSSLDGRDGEEGRRDREPESQQSDEVGGLDEQLSERSGTNSSDRDDLRLSDSGISEDSEVVPPILEPSDIPLSEKDKGIMDPEALSFEYVLTNVLQYHKYLRVAGAEIQNFFLNEPSEEARISFVKECYDSTYIELLTPVEEYRVGYHASENGLEVWTGGYLGSKSRVTVPWNIIASAIDVLIQNDTYLARSEAVAIPSEDEQVALIEKAINNDEVVFENSLNIPQQVIDEVLCCDGNTVDCKYDLCSYYKRAHSLSEKAEYIRDRFNVGTGKGFIIDDDAYSVVFEDEGIRIAEGKTVTRAESTVVIPWDYAAKRIGDLLSLGRYMSGSEYAQVEDKVLDNTAKLIWFTHRDVIPTLARRGFSDDVLTGFGGLPLDKNLHSYTTDTEKIKEVLSNDPEAVQRLLADVKFIMFAGSGDEPVLRVGSFFFGSIVRLHTYLSDLTRDTVEYPVNEGFEPSYKAFITDDEVDLDLAWGSHVQDGKYRIYRYFNEHHTAAEKADFLKDEYGTGGGNHALGGVHDGNHSHNSKGLTLSRGDISKPYDSVSLSWSAVAKRIDNLIAENRYLSQEEIDNIPDYERDLIATGIYHFFDGAALEFERPFLIGSDNKDALAAIVEALDDPEKLEDIIRGMREYMATLGEDHRMYNYCTNALRNAERFASGISLFDFEARRKEFGLEADEPVASGVAALEDVDYVYRVDVGDTVVLGDGSFEVMDIADDKALLNDVNFPLSMTEMALSELYSTLYVERSSENIHLWVAEDLAEAPSLGEMKTDKGENGVQTVAVDSSEVDLSVEIGLGTDTGTGSETESGASSAPETLNEAPEGESGVFEGIRELDGENSIESAETASEGGSKVYRYYSRYRNVEENVPRPEGNEPLNVVDFDESRYIEDFGVWACGYIEYSAPLPFPDIQKYDLMLYQPPIVAPETGKRYQLGFGHLGNGTTVWNRLETEYNDYKTVAHISEEGNVNFYEQGMPQEAVDNIQKMADRDKAAYEEKLRVAAEALAEVERRYGAPFAKKDEEKTINRKTMPCRNYKQFRKFADKVLDGEYTYMRFEGSPEGGYEPLYIELIDKNTIAMAHTYVQNGDLMYDPEMVFTFDNEKEELQALSYEMSAMGSYQRVYDDNGRVNVGLQRELNSFLNTWLKNINDQGRELVRFIDRDGNEIDFTIDKDAVGLEVEAGSNGELAVDEITLLTINEYDKYQDVIPLINGHWWLRSPGEDGADYNSACFVNDTGVVNEYGDVVGETYYNVRPVLKLSGLQADMEPGDKVVVGGHSWTLVDKENKLVLCDEFVGHSNFDEISSDWEKSKLKTWLENEFLPTLNVPVIKDDISVPVIDSEQEHSSFDFDEYLKVKDIYPDDIVAYQVGDFYEFLGEDAEKVAKELDIVLTSRDVGLSERIAMCGIPSYIFEDRMNMLIQNGYNIAVHGIDQTTGKEITVDYESEYHTFVGNKEMNFDSDGSELLIPEDEKLVYEPEERSVPVVSKPLNGEGLVDYHIEALEHGSESSSPKERFRNNIQAIRTLKELEAQDRLANSEEQKILAAYVGWGGLSDAFDESKSAWASEYDELQSLLTPEEYASAKSSTLSAFYTSPEIVSFMYKTLQDMGFKKGNILEPSCGVGNFIGMLPPELSGSKVYGVELDSISGRIAQQLYQKQDIRVQGFEKSDFPDSFFDVAIGNVPFGDFKVNDRKYNKNNFFIHDYFFAKALDKVRPGGIVAFITSKGTMDKENPAVRKYIAQRAELLGAVRLPDTAFKANAGTDVTSDIIFLKKRDRIIDIEPGWMDLDYLTDPETGAIITAPNEEEMKINSYFSDHPECVMGQIEVESTRYGYDTTCKLAPGEFLSERLASVDFGARDAFEERDELEELDEPEGIMADPTVRNFSYTVVDGAVYYRQNSMMYPARFKSVDEENRVRGMISLRDGVRELINMQLEDYSEVAIVSARNALNTAYEKFSKKYGLINDKKNRKAFTDDEGYYLLASLENLDDDGKLKSKADIFYKRTIKPHVEITSVETSVEALEVSISEKARVDIAFMSSLSGKSAEEIEAELSGVIFRVPGVVDGDGNPVFVPGDEYLSGNVREKLRVAREFAEKDPIYRVNVDALEKAQPRDLDASEVSVRLGTTWIPPEYIDEFMYELLNTPSWAKWDIKTKFAEVTGEWFIEGKGYDRYNVKSTVEYGTDRISAYKIIEDTLNLRDARIFDYVEDENGRRKAVLNKEETTIAQQKQELIKEAFVEWIWRDPDRREFLTDYYNENFNCIRPREFDGSHLSFSGINPEITLKKHQLDAIARIIYGGNTLLAHVVGAGKTFEMVAAAQESKRLGLCNKSMFVVPNHLIEQFAAEYMQLYPSANILCSTKKDFEPANRKKFCGRIATGDYDAIIIGHSQFEKIPMSVERQEMMIRRQINDIVDGITAAKDDKGERFTVKQLEKTKKNLEDKLQRLTDDSRKDDVVTFEELGVDRLFIDEAHYYKNLFLYTKMRNVAGIGSREAQKSSDLFMKCRYLDEITDGKGVIFATGTPVSNSMTELYTMQRYLQYDKLEKYGLQHFDSWASTFGETVTAIELAPEGKGYRAKTRFARFNNIPELMAMFKEVADVQTADMLHLPVPKANYHTVSLQPSEIQKELVANLADRATAIHNRLVKPNEDNMLLVTNDGRKLALDQRLVDPLLGDFEGNKVNACADKVFEIWENNAVTKATQLVFCDLSTPKGGEFDVYTSLKDKLIEMGIPKNEIAFIHNAKTELQKKSLFDKVRRGKVRVLMGSTQKMGAGTNVQDKLIALHDLDCPWRPADLEQRSGRIVRQGNTNDEVDIYRYVTKDTFDAYLYQLLENKQSFISQIMTSKSPSRSAEDIDEAVLSYAEIKSLATGDPRIKEKMDLDVSVKRLKLLKQSFLRERYTLEDKVLKTYPKDIAYYTAAIASCKDDITLLAAHTSSDKDYFYPMTINGVTYTEKAEAGEALIEICRKKKSRDEEDIGDYKGFRMSIKINGDGKVELSLKNKLTYSTGLSVDKFGNITRINNALGSIADRLERNERKLADTKAQLEDAKRQLNKPFKHEAELKEKSARLDQLNIELSLDKDNAIDISSSLEDKVSSDGKEKVSVVPDYSAR